MVTLSPAAELNAGFDHTLIDTPGLSPRGGCRVRWQLVVLGAAA